MYNGGITGHNKGTIDSCYNIGSIGNCKFSGGIAGTNENIIKFRDYLNDHGIVATIRRELGSDIDAACGQLRKKEVNR